VVEPLSEIRAHLPLTAGRAAGLRSTRLRLPTTMPPIGLREWLRCRLPTVRHDFDVRGLDAALGEQLFELRESFDETCFHFATRW